MSGFQTELDPQAAKAAEEAAAGGNGSFPPLPSGKYQVTIAKVEKLEDYANSGPNAKKKVVRLRFRIVDHSPTGKGRVIFGRVPLFSRFAPNEKHPEGASAKGFWDFWEKSMGVDRAYILTGQPLPSDIQGKALTITVSAPKPPDSHNPLGSNEVDYYDAAGDVNATPVRQPGVPVAPWLDANDNLLPGFSGGAPAAPGAPAAAPAAPAAPPAWGAVPAVPPAAPAWGAPQAAAPAAPAAPPAAPAAPAQWAPAPADVAYAQQAAAPAAPAAPMAPPAAPQWGQPQVDPALQAAANASAGY